MGVIANSINMAATFTYLTDAAGNIWQVGIDSQGRLTQTLVTSIPGVPSAPTINAFPAMTGQQLLSTLDINLGGLKNSVTTQQKWEFLNAGKDEMWMILKQLDENYFVIDSQAVDSTKTNYFGPLNTTTREYTLPTDCRDILFIECTAPIGQEFTQFVKSSVTSPEFREARQNATANNNQGSSIITLDVYHYDVIGKLTFKLAEFPQQAFTLIITYVRALPVISAASVVDEILTPWTRKIVDYAVQRVMLLKDPGAWQEWVSVWRSDIQQTMQSANRSDSDIRTASDYNGDY